MIFSKWMKKHGLDPLDIDLGLIEVRDNPDESWTMRALAGHSVGMPPEDGFLAARELQEALCWAADGRPEGKRRLAEILGCRGDDYQRALYYSVAGRGPVAMLLDLQRLVAMMQARADAAHVSAANGHAVAAAEPPYRFFGEADGPRGRFEEDFDFGPAWDGIARSR
mgnify:FL=1